MLNLIEDPGYVYLVSIHITLILLIYDRGQKYLQCQCAITTSLLGCGYLRFCRIINNNGTTDTYGFMTPSKFTL